MTNFHLIQNLVEQTPSQIILNVCVQMKLIHINGMIYA